MSAYAPLAIGFAALLGGSALAPVAEAQAPRRPANAERVSAVYRVTLNGLAIGHFRLSTALTGARYSIRGDLRFGLFDGMLFQWNGSTASAGTVGQGEPRPTAYGFAYSSGGRSEQLRVTFRDQTVKTVTIQPKTPAPPGAIPVTNAHLTRVLDPMSALFLGARSDDRLGDPNVCRQTVPIFDGRQRYDLVLSYKRTLRVNRPGYAGPAVVCRVKYVPVSGHVAGDRGTAYLAATNDIEVWLVPLPNSRLYVPYHLHLPTIAGPATITSSELQVQTGRNTRKAELSR